MSPEPPSTPPFLGTLDYLAEVAKDWARERFATAHAETSRSRPTALSSAATGCAVADSLTLARSGLPTTSARATTRPTAWCRSATLTLLNDTETGTVALEHELVEVLVTDGEEIIAEAACVARIPGFPPCLGRFRSTW